MNGVIYLIFLQSPFLRRIKLSARGLCSECGLRATVGALPCFIANVSGRFFLRLLRGDAKMSGVPPAVKTALFSPLWTGRQRENLCALFFAFAIFAPCAQSFAACVNAAEPRSPGRFPNLVPQFEMR